MSVRERDQEVSLSGICAAGVVGSRGDGREGAGELVSSGWTERGAETQNCTGLHEARVLD